jgi:hypothetical protein
MEPRIAEVAARIRALREDTGLTAGEMAEAAAIRDNDYGNDEE